MILDVVVDLAKDDDHLIPIMLHENEADPTVAVNVVDVVFNHGEDKFDIVTDKFVSAIPGVSVQGATDLPTDYIVYNIPKLISQLANSLVFLNLYEAIVNMSVAIANSK